MNTISHVYIFSFLLHSLSVAKSPFTIPTTTATTTTTTITTTDNATFKAVPKNERNDGVIIDDSHKFKNNEIYYNAFEIKSLQTNGRSNLHGISSSSLAFLGMIKPKQLYEHTSIPIHNNGITTFKRMENFKNAFSKRNPGQLDGSTSDNSHLVMVVVPLTVENLIRYNDQVASTRNGNWNKMPIISRVINVSSLPRLWNIIRYLISCGSTMFKLILNSSKIKLRYTEIVSQQQHCRCKRIGVSKLKLKKIKFLSMYTSKMKNSARRMNESTSLFMPSTRTMPVKFINVRRQMIRENSTDAIDKPRNIVRARQFPRPTSSTIEYSSDKDNDTIENQYLYDNHMNNKFMSNNFLNLLRSNGTRINQQPDIGDYNVKESHDHHLKVTPLDLNLMINTSVKLNKYLKRVNIPVDLQPVAIFNQSNIKFNTDSNNSSVHKNVNMSLSFGKYNNSVAEICIKCVNNVSTFNDIQQHERMLNGSWKIQHSTPRTNNVYVNEREILNASNVTSVDHMKILNTYITASTSNSHIMFNEMSKRMPNNFLHDDSKINISNRQIPPMIPLNIAPTIYHNSPDVVATSTTTEKIDVTAELSLTSDVNQNIVNINQSDGKHQEENLLSNMSQVSSDDNSSIPESNSLIKNIVHGGFHGVNIFKRIGQQMMDNSRKKFNIL